MKNKDFFRIVLTIVLGLCISLARIVYPSSEIITTKTVIIEFLLELLICSLIVFINWKQIKEIFSKKIKDINKYSETIFTVIIIMFFGGLILDLAFQGIYYLITNTNVRDLYDPASKIGQDFSSTFFLPVLLVQCIIAPIEEEFVFRHTFRQVFSKDNVLHILLYILLSSWAFGFIHSAVLFSPTMVTYINTGIIMSILYLKYKDIRLLIFAHMGYNAFIWFSSLLSLFMN